MKLETYEYESEVCSQSDMLPSGLISFCKFESVWRECVYWDISHRISKAADLFCVADGLRALHLCHRQAAFVNCNLSEGLPEQGKSDDPLLTLPVFINTWTGIPTQVKPE